MLHPQLAEHLGRKPARQTAQVQYLMFEIKFSIDCILQYWQQRTSIYDPSSGAITPRGIETPPRPAASATRTQPRHWYNKIGTFFKVRLSCKLFNIFVHQTKS